MAGADIREAVVKLPISGKAVLERFEARERLSELFTIDVQVLCEQVEDFFPHLGEAVSIKVTDAGADVRDFHGLLFEAEYVEETGAGHRFRLQLRPWLHILTRNLDYKIFQNKTTTDILKLVFDSRGQSLVDFSKLRGSYQPREYCVQYRETDFNFVSRLMEEEGIYYFFEHSADGHKMVLCDAPGSHERSAYKSLHHVRPGAPMYRQGAHFWVWNERVGTGAEKEVKLRNFDFLRPQQAREGEYGEGTKTPADKAEVYDYPANFLEPDEGKKRGEVILQSARRLQRAYHGEGDAMGLETGTILKLEGHIVDRLNATYLIVGLHYGLETETYRSGAPSTYRQAEIAVEAVPGDSHWRAPITTVKPVARGPETAIVAGPAPDEQIYTDNEGHGRVKVRFHWDRSGSPEGETTCWIRVSHNSAGNGFGNIILPRIGQEVIVDFLDGDPDRPIITGRVYNGARPEPYKLPDKKKLSVWRSWTIGKRGTYDGAEEPGAAPDPGYNEIQMDDTGGDEMLAFRAQRNMVTYVHYDQQLKINRDQMRRVGRDRKSAIKRHDTMTVEEGDHTHTVDKGKRVTTIEKDDNLTVRSGNMATQVKMGNVSLKVDMGSVKIEAMQKIELVVGNSSILIDQKGVTIKGMMIEAKATMMLTAEGMMTDLKGNVMLTAKGAIIMIN